MELCNLKTIYLQGCHENLQAKFPDLYENFHYFSLIFKNNFTGFPMALLLSNVTLTSWDKNTVHNIDRLEYFLRRKQVTGPLRSSDPNKIPSKQGLVKCSVRHLGLVIYLLQC